MNEKKFHVGVKALIQNEEGKILLVRVNTKELKGNKHGAYWDIPGGRIKEGDDVERTLRKEIEEELGTNDIEIVKPFDSIISNIEIPVGNEKFGIVLAVYLCNLGTKKIQAEPRTYRIQMGFD